MNERFRTLLLWGAVLVAAWALFHMARACRSPAADYLETEQEAVRMFGAAGAEAVAEFLGAGASIVVLVQRQEEGALPPAAAEDFMNGVKEKGLRVLATEEVSLGLVDEKGERVGQRVGILGPLIVELAGRYAEADGLVSLAGLPDLAPVQLAELKRRGVKLLVATPCDMTRLTPMMESGVVAMAVVPRLEALDGGYRAGARGRRAFDQSYQVITAEHLDLLPRL